MEMVQRKIFVPIPRFVIVVLGLPEFVIVPEPLTNDHAPDPTTGVLAAIVAELMVTDWLGPALAVVGTAEALCNSCTPMSTVAPNGRAFTKRSVVGATVFVPRLIAGEQSVM